MNQCINQCLIVLIFILVIMIGESLKREKQLEKIDPIEQIDKK